MRPPWAAAQFHPPERASILGLVIIISLYFYRDLYNKYIYPQTKYELILPVFLACCMVNSYCIYVSRMHILCRVLFGVGGCHPFIFRLLKPYILLLYYNFAAFLFMYMWLTPVVVINISVHVSWTHRQEGSQSI